MMFVQVDDTYLKECPGVAVVAVWSLAEMLPLLLQVNGRRVMFHPFVVLPSLSLVPLFPSASVPSLLILLLPSASVVIFVAVLVMFSSGSIRRSKPCSQLRLTSSSWCCLGSWSLHPPSRSHSCSHLHIVTALSVLLSRCSRSAFRSSFINRLRRSVPLKVLGCYCSS